MKIGVMGHYFIEWTGGFDFLRMTLESLLAVTDDRIEIHLLLPVRGPRLKLRLMVRHVRDLLLRRSHNYPSPEAVLTACAEFDKRIHIIVMDSGVTPIANYCHRQGIDVLLPSVHALPPSIKVPWVGYFADFQHKHLPRFFTLKERDARDAHFTHIMKVASAPLPKMPSGSIPGTLVASLPYLSVQMFHEYSPEMYRNCVSSTASRDDSLWSPTSSGFIRTMLLPVRLSLQFSVIKPI